ncbi:MAG: hypothetical protein AAF401_11130 [Pseudomonadota bacterium]
MLELLDDAGAVVADNVGGCAGHSPGGLNITASTNQTVDLTVSAFRFTIFFDLVSPEGNASTDTPVVDTSATLLLGDQLFDNPLTVGAAQVPLPSNLLSLIAALAVFGATRG